MDISLVGVHKVEVLASFLMEVFLFFADYDLAVVVDGWHVVPAVLVNDGVRYCLHPDEHGLLEGGDVELFYAKNSDPLLG